MPVINLSRDLQLDGQAAQQGAGSPGAINFFTVHFLFFSKGAGCVLA
jgi:hypothetical protein